MIRQLLSHTGKRVLFSVLLCCGFAVVAVAEAENPAPAFKKPACTVHSTRLGKVVTWQIKGEVSVVNLSNSDQVQVALTFQKQPKGGAWVEVMVVTQTTSVNKGTAAIDTDYQNLTLAPAKGDQYRILLSGTYTGGIPPRTLPLVAGAATPTTPVP